MVSYLKSMHLKKLRYSFAKPQYIWNTYKLLYFIILKFITLNLLHRIF